MARIPKIATILGQTFTVVSQAKGRTVALFCNFESLVPESVQQLFRNLTLSTLSLERSSRL